MSGSNPQPVDWRAIAQGAMPRFYRMCQGIMAWPMPSASTLEFLRRRHSDLQLGQPSADAAPGGPLVR